MPDKTAPQSDTSSAKFKFPRREKMVRLLAFWYVRIILLLFAAFYGLLLAKHGGFLLVKIGLSNLTIASNKQLAILLMSLPVLFVLWVFRTYDTREQIQEARENAKAARDGVEATREALNADTLGRYLSMLFSENLSARCVGLIRLAEIKRQGKFVKEIDNATRRHLDFNRADLQNENLSGLDLRGVQLIGAQLQGALLIETNMCFAKMRGAYLIGTKLMGANLKEADLTGARFLAADLRNAKLQNANLIDVIDFKHANTEGAVFSTGTKFSNINSSYK